ncbi:MAG: 50S ribosomal protein L6 [archaeon]|nr:50S ribosomal protein L6 [archaeon]
MRRDLSKIIEIPEGVNVKIDGSVIIVKGKEGENKKLFRMGKVKIESNEKKVTLSAKGATKKEKKTMNTITAHINNMIKGVGEKYEYTLKICYSHFPITVEIKGKEAFVKNFLGEKVPRKMKIKRDVEINIEKDIIKIISTDKELAGQTAADFEKTTWIRLRDRRIFQDGIFIINKAGENI